MRERRSRIAQALHPGYGLQREAHVAGAIALHLSCMKLSSRAIFLAP
jgi:hypothetical protein